VTNSLPVVSIPDGQLMGKVVSGYDKKSVFAFLGVPFASPPLNQLRFKRTVPVEPWNRVRRATDFPPNCLQVFPDFIKDVMKPVNLTNNSEDCLYLNVWTPTLNPAAKKPVMFWIHGGAFQFGSSSNYETDGRIISSFGDVVVVAANYRLNAFGFLNLENDAVPGNMGMYDQAMALKWVKNNIRYFGGDPDSITLWGESSGAVSVSAHLISPVTQDLFNRVILESGSLFMQEVVFNQYEDLANKLLQMIGCNDNKKKNENINNDSSSNIREKKEVETEDEDDEGSEDDFIETITDNKESVTPYIPTKEDDNSRIDCLMKTSSDEILKAVKSINEINPMSFVISPREFFLDSSSPKSIRSDLRNFLPPEGKDLLMGFNSDEGSLILNSILPNDFDRYSSPKQIESVENAQQVLVDLFSSRFHVPKQIVRTALPSYLPESIDNSLGNKSQHMRLISKGIYDFIGHNVFVCPLITFADEILKINSNNLKDSSNKKRTNFNIFMYEFSGKTSYTRKLDPWLGSGGVHYEEVPLVFGLPFMKTSSNSSPSSSSPSFSSKESKLSLRLMKAWINFVKTG
jgi:carboxylesterase type B